MATKQNMLLLATIIQIILFVSLNAQDTRPLFLDEPYIFSLKETEIQPNAKIGEIKVQDRRDSNANNGIIFKITSNPYFFKIGPVNRDINNENIYKANILTTRSFNNNDLNDNTILLRAIQTFNNQELQIFSDINIQIDIQDVNNNAPTFDNTLYKAYVSEGMTNGATVPGLVIIVNDYDKGLNALYSLTLNAISPGSEGIFGVSPTSGSNNLAASLIVNQPNKIKYNKDLTKRTYNLELSAQETNTTDRKKNTAKIILEVTEPLNQPPSFPSFLNPIIIYNDLAVNSIISRNIMAVDPDNDQITYTITNNQNSQEYFRIHQSTGTLSLKKPLNPIPHSRFSFNVIATDSRGLSAQQSVFILVLDKNSSGPRFSQNPYTAHVTENSTTLLPTVQLMAQLVPMIGDRVINYKLARNNTQKVREFFIVNKTSGFVNLKKAPDYSDTQDPNNLKIAGFFRVEVLAYVVGYPEIPETRGLVQVFVDDINNHAPKFYPNNNNNTYYRTIKQTTPGNFRVIKLNTSDKDVGRNGEVEYIIKEGSRDDFTIDNQGIIRTAPFPILSPERNYTINVIAFDKGQPPLSSTAIVHVNITRVIYQAPTFQNNFIFYVREDAEKEKRIGFVRASHPDPQAQIRYDVETGSWKFYNNDKLVNNVNDWFTLGSNGEIKVAGNLIYNLVTKVTFVVIASVTNMNENINNNTAKVPVEILILPIGGVKDEVVFSPLMEKKYLTINEKVSIGTKISTFTAVSIKDQKEVNNFKLQPLDPGSEDIFKIYQNGTLYLNKYLVYRDLNQHIFKYNLTAFGQSQSTIPAVVMVTITVLSTSSKVYFIENVYNFTVFSNDSIGTSLGRIEAVNTVSNRNLIYSFNPEKNDYFFINPHTGEITVTKKINDFYKPPLQMNIIAIANVTNVNNTQTYLGSTLVNITIKMVKELAPIFNQNNYLFSYQGVAKGVIGQIFARDPNNIKPSPVYYYIEPNNNQFEINKTTGILTAKNDITKNTNLTIKSTISDYESLFNFAHIIIKVNQINVAPPTFTFPSVSSYNLSNIDNFKMDIGTEGGGVITLGGTDSSYFEIKGDKLYYNGPKNSNNGFFYYNLILYADNGFKKISKPLNLYFYSNQVLSFDCKSNPLIKMVSRTPGYLDNPITLPPGSSCNSNSENATFNFDIKSVRFQNNPINDYNDLFSVDNPANEGRIKIKKKLKYENNEKYNILLRVSNNDFSKQSEINVLIKLSPNDTEAPFFDSNDPECPGSPSKIYLGILDITPKRESVVRVVASDCFPNQEKIQYSIASTTCYNNGETMVNMNNKFDIGPTSGTIVTNSEDMLELGGGYCQVVVLATKKPFNPAKATVYIYILTGIEKKKIIFSNSASSLRNNFEFIRGNLSALSGNNTELIFDPPTASFNPDGSIKSSQSSICYLAVKNNKYYNMNLTQPMKNYLKNYDYENSGSICYPRGPSTENWSGKWFLWYILIAFSILVFVIAFILVCCICFFWPVYKRQIAKNIPYVDVDLL